MKFCGLIHLFHTDSFQWGRAKGGSHHFPAQQIHVGYGSIKLGKDDDCRYWCTCLVYLPMMPFH